MFTVCYAIRVRPEAVIRIKLEECVSLCVNKNINLPWISRLVLIRLLSVLMFGGIKLNSVIDFFKIVLGVVAFALSLSSLK